MGAGAAAVPPMALLVLAVACISVGSILVKLAAAPALAVAFYRIGLATVLLSPFAARPLARHAGRLSRRQLGAAIGAGIALALHFATWIASLSYTSVAASVLLVNTAPLFTMALAPLLLGEPVSRLIVSTGALAIAGSALIALDDQGRGDASMLGNALAVAGAVTLSLYHIAGRGLRAALPLDAYLLLVWGSAAVTLLALAVAGGVPLWPWPPRTLAVFLALALVPTLAGHGLVNRSLRHIPAPRVGLFMLGEPIGATALAWLVFGEQPGLLTAAGAALVLAALAVIVRRGE